MNGRSTHLLVALLVLATATGLAAEAPPSLIWQHDADIDGRGDSAAAVVAVGGTLVLAGQGALEREPGLMQRDDALLLQGLSTATGELLWSRRLDSAVLLHLRADRDRVFLATRNSYFSVQRKRLPSGGRLIAVEIGSGETLWEETYRGPDRGAPGFDLTFAELVDGRLIYGGYRTELGRQAPFVQARAADSGRLLWEHLEAVAPDSDGGIAFAASARGRLFVAGVRSVGTRHSGFAAAWSVRRGARLWETAIDVPAAIAAQGRRCAVVERRFPSRRDDPHTVTLLHARSGRRVSELPVAPRPRHDLGDVRLTSRPGTIFVAIDQRRSRFPAQQSALLFAIATRNGATRWQREIELGRDLGVNRLTAARRTLLLQFTDGFFDDGEALDRVHAFSTNDGRSRWTLTASDAWLTGVEGTDDGLVLLLGHLKGPFPKADVLLRALR